MLKKEFNNRTLIGWLLILIAALLPNLSNKNGFDYLITFFGYLFVLYLVFTFVAPPKTTPPPTRRVIKEPFSELDTLLMLHTLWDHYRDNKKIQELLSEVVRILQEDLTEKS